MSRATALVVAAQGMGLRLPGSDNQGCIHESNRTVVNKAAVLN